MNELKSFLTKWKNNTSKENIDYNQVYDYFRTARNDLGYIENRENALIRINEIKSLENNKPLDEVIRDTTSKVIESQRIRDKKVSPTGKSFSSIGGVQINYARTAKYPYGSKGQKTVLYCADDFYPLIDRFAYDIWRSCPLGSAKIITSAGAYADYSISPGRHAEGRAFDLDAIFWSNYSFITKNFESQPEFYLGIESIARKHFGTVLTYHYNSEHKDHIHLDEGSGNTEFNHTLRTHALYTQNVLKHLYDQDIQLTGELSYSNNNIKALRNVLTGLGISFTSGNEYVALKQNWKKFLSININKAFGG